MKTLDRSRSFGTIHPPHEGAHYSQDGYYFDAQGKLVESLLKPEQRAAFAKKPPAPPRPAPVAPVGSAAPKPPASEAAPSGPAPEGAQQHGTAAEPPPTDGDDGDPVNIEQWLRDPATANFNDVRKAVKARYHVWMTAKPAVVTFLVNDQKLLPVEEIAAELRELLPKE